MPRFTFYRLGRATLLSQPLQSAGKQACERLNRHHQCQKQVDRLVQAAPWQPTAAQLAVAARQEVPIFVSALQDIARSLQLNMEVSFCVETHKHSYFCNDFICLLKILQIEQDVDNKDCRKAVIMDPAPDNPLALLTEVTYFSNSKKITNVQTMLGLEEDSAPQHVRGRSLFFCVWGQGHPWRL